MLSAHRTPEETAAFVKDAVRRGRQGLHLRRGRRGPPRGRRRGAHDPPGDRRADRQRRARRASIRCSRRCRCRPGMPVATVAVGGAENAGLLAAQIVALGRPGAGDEGRGASGPRAARRSSRATPRFERARDASSAWPTRSTRRSTPRSPRSAAARSSPTRRRRSTVSASTRSTSWRWRACARLKGRGEKAISVLVDGAAMLARLCAEVPPRAAALMRRHWPGALTIALPARAGLPAALVSDGCVAVRQSPHPTGARRW